MYGRFAFVGDLVAAADRQRLRLGASLLTGGARYQARELDCHCLVLNAGFHMALAQRFTFGEIKSPDTNPLHRAIYSYGVFGLRPTSRLVIQAKNLPVRGPISSHGRLGDKDGSH